MSNDKSIKICDLTDEQLDRAIAFNQSKMSRLNFELSEREYGYPFGWTETAIKIGALSREKARRNNE